MERVEAVLTKEGTDFFARHASGKKRDANAGKSDTE